VPSLRTKILTGVFLAWPWWAHAQPPATPSAPAGAVRTISDEAFQRWIKEDTQVVQGILLSLKHIDQLVADIERMVRQLPDFGVAAKPAPPPPPVVVEKTVIQEVEVPGPLGGWMPTLSGAALLALLAFWMGRKLGARRQPTPLPAAAPAPPAAPPAAPAPPAAAKEITPAPPPAPPPMQPAPTPIEPAPSSIEAPLGAESDQSIELAEIMLSMGLGHGAVQTLTEQIRNQPKQALRHWLKLLEIYRRNGQQAEFERSAEELRLHFNVRPEDWHPQPGAPQTIENFPHIAKRLTELWGTADCLVYMENLLADNRGGARSGFPQPVAEELLLLISLMRATYSG
jgi:pilus assembly protein FimV